MKKWVIVVNISNVKYPPEKSTPSEIPPLRSLHRVKYYLRHNTTIKQTFVGRKVFWDTKEVSTNREWKDRQYNGQKKTDKRTNNDPQKTTQKAKDWATWTPLKPRMNSGASEHIVYISVA